MPRRLISSGLVLVALVGCSRLTPSQLAGTATVLGCWPYGFEEVKKRSKKMATAFRNEGSCLLLFYAVVRTLQLRKIRMPG